MIDYVKKILMGQFEAAFCMMNECVQKCPQEHWDSKIAKYAFWHVVHHTLYFVDLYLSPNEESFRLRDVHSQGWSELHEEFPSRRFDKREIAEYLAIAGRRRRRHSHPRRVNPSSASRGSIGCRSHAAKCIYTTSGTFSIIPAN